MHMGAYVPMCLCAYVMPIDLHCYQKLSMHSTLQGITELL